MLTRYEQAVPSDLCPPLSDWDFETGRGLLLWGPKGTGKTHAAVALWREWRRRHPSSHLTDRAPFVSVARLMQEKRRQMDADTGWVEPNWKSVEFAVFDDWDKCRISDWVREELFTIIDILYCRMVPVIITSNLAPRDFAHHSGEFITDRIKEMAIPVPMDGPSRRSAPVIVSPATRHANAPTHEAFREPPVSVLTDAERVAAEAETMRLLGMNP